SFSPLVVFLSTLHVPVPKHTTISPTCQGTPPKYGKVGGGFVAHAPLATPNIRSSMAAMRAVFSMLLLIINPLRVLRRFPGASEKCGSCEKIEIRFRYDGQELFLIVLLQTYHVL